MTSDTTQELSPFLQKQAEIMAARAQQDRDVEERQKHAIVPAAQEAPDIRGKYVVETQNLDTGKTSYREITPAPIAPPAKIHQAGASNVSGTSTTNRRTCCRHRRSRDRLRHRSGGPGQLFCSSQET